MGKGNESVRDRLLARLPQPENVAAYREETASLLAKHNKALSAEKRSAYLLIVCVYVLAMLILNGWAARHGAEVAIMFEAIASVMFLIVIFMGLETVIHKYHVGILKEVKQIQLQVLELQASLQKDGNK